MIQKRLISAFIVLMSVARFAAASEAIDAKYKEIGAATLGKPAGAEKSGAGGGRVRLYANGGIYWSKATGTHAVYGQTYDKYKSLKGERGELGYPVSDVLTRPEGQTQTLFRHGYILVDKAGAADAQVMSKATFTADGVTLKGMKGTKTPQNDAFFLPESGGGTTFSCDCTMGNGDPGTGACDLRVRGDVIRCVGNGCRSSCRLTLVKGAQ
jgi:hypothetical protein